MTTLMDLLLPRHCLLCGTNCNQANLCTDCMDSLPSCSPVQLHRRAGCDQVISALQYVSPVDYLVCQFKFSRNLAAGQALYHCLLSCLHKTSAELPDALVPVPLHGRRQFQRTFNQADVLARRLAHALKIPVLSHQLRRQRHTAAQSGLNADLRRRNIQGAFRLRGPLKGMNLDHVVLVDDVMTTGTTLNECARVLTRAGVRAVSAWTAARADAHDQAPATA